MGLSRSAVEEVDLIPRLVRLLQHEGCENLVLEVQQHSYQPSVLKSAARLILAKVAPMDLLSFRQVNKQVNKQTCQQTDKQTNKQPTSQPTKQHLSNGRRKSFIFLFLYFILYIFIF
jgi:hypothetical protein